MVDAVAVSLLLQDCRQYTAGSRQAGMSVFESSKTTSTNMMVCKDDGLAQSRIRTFWKDGRTRSCVFPYCRYQQWMRVV